MVEKLLDAEGLLVPFIRETTEDFGNICVTISPKDHDDFMEAMKEVSRNAGLTLQLFVINYYIQVIYK
jgi:ABC-type metal ion transport system substrate-binding protein